ncbi:unnamed protein product [Heterobilharzia americana]|nr:unnamed protein product [Heterobilharzia americana]CAH8595991.1 unnamed protein product [Heterobilharzia americana]
MFASLKGLSAIVTGGSSGLGLATTKKLIAEGCKVLVCDLQKSAALSELDNDCVFCETDVSLESDAKKAVDLVKQQFSNLHILVNCAGYAMASKTYNVQRHKPHSLDLFEKVIKTNLVGTFNMIRIATGLMLENQPDDDNQRGVIINTASIAAYEGQAGQAAYAASKGGIVGLTLPIARDLAREGIRCVSIAPGLFHTKTIMGGRGFHDYRLEYLNDIQLVIQRMGIPEEFADSVINIIQNPMINGSTVRLDGGGRLIFL